MKHLPFILFLLAVITLAGCKKEDNINPDGVEYEVTFIGNWSAANHPTDYPSAAHFSKVTGMSHNSAVSLFEAGALATTGMKDMAERGKVSPLDDELRAVIETGNGFDLILGDGISTGTGSTTVSFTVDEDHSLVSLVSMLAPSPDWFVEVSDVDLYDGGEWVNDLIVDGVVWDAGTDSGTTFASDDLVTDPATGISLFFDPPLGDGLFVTPAVAQFRFVKK